MTEYTWEIIKDLTSDAEAHLEKMRGLRRSFACKKCGGSGSVDLSREPCSTAQIDCPECDGKGYA